MKVKDVMNLYRDCTHVHLEVWDRGFYDCLFDGIYGYVGDEVAEKDIMSIEPNAEKVVMRVW